MRINTFLKRYFPALLIFITLLTFSLFAYNVTQSSVKVRRSRLFNSRVQRAIETVNNRMTDYIQILKGCQGLYYASDSVTAEDWAIYTKNLNVSANYPGIQAMTTIAYIPRKNAFDLQTRIRKSGVANYTIYTIKSTRHLEYITPVVYIQPINNHNLKALGFDLWSETKRREAMKRAMLTGEPSITKRITLIQEANDSIRPGFLMFLPIYDKPKNIKSVTDRKKQIKGFVSNVFRANDLMSGLLKRFFELDVEIYDGKQQIGKNLLYRSNRNNDINLTKNAKLKADTVIYVAGSPWRFCITPNNYFGSAVEQQQPLLILICGLATSILLTTLTGIIITRKAQITKELMRRKLLEHKKDEFIGIASHELKTPLTSIQASIQLLERSQLSDRNRSFVNKANQNIKKLNNLIADLLDVSKIQAGKLQLNVADFLLSDLIDDSIENVLHMYSSHEIIRNNHLPELHLQGDKFRLEQAINNLLLNAIKYSPVKSKIFINAHPLNKAVRIEVIDQGIGISKENQKKIFQRFFRAADVSPVISGLGMGLYLSHEIIKRHNGEIGVQSELGKGSTFYIELPLQ